MSGVHNPTTIVLSSSCTVVVAILSPYSNTSQSLTPTVCVNTLPIPQKRFINR